MRSGTAEKPVFAGRLIIRANNGEVWRELFRMLVMRKEEEEDHQGKTYLHLTGAEYLI
jgi:hypothetical protein